jgi:hypothetical protein
MSGGLGGNRIIRFQPGRGDKALTEPTAASSPPLVRLVDPDRIPTRTVNQVLAVTFIGNVFALDLATREWGPSPDGQPEPQARVCARLRFDVQIADFIVAEIQRVFAEVTPPPKDQQN